ncbi:MAG TPA: GNAT family N-acetyltransferase [Anaerolineales bacterium]|nr:GNAT family N-acetyltransferase [Anaerolineales bacterium]
MNKEIIFVDADEELKNRLAQEWGEKAARHMHLEDGFSILAMKENALVGLISVYWKILPPPLPETCEGYIDILEVHKDFRRRGIAAQLIDLSMQRAREKGVYQMRSWSSLDKTEAIPMWKALGFGLCPATTFPKGQEVKGYFVSKLL